MRALLAAFLLLSAASAAAGVSVATGTVAALQKTLAKEPGPFTKECREFVAGLAPELDYGVLDAPLDWAAPAGARARVFFYGRLRAGAKTPVVLVNGGPGGASWNLYLNRTKRAAALVGLPFIFFDQRGNGCSSPFPDAAAVSPHFGTAAIVRDLEAIREGVYGRGSRWKVFGQSFGSTVVHRYVIDAPDGLDVAYAHGFALLKDARAYRRVHREYGLGFLDRFYKEHPQALCLRGVMDRLVARDCPAAKTAFEKVECAAPYFDPLSGDRIRNPTNWPATAKAAAAFCAGPLPAPEPAKKEEALSGRDAAIATIVTQEYLPPGFEPEDPFACREGLAALAASREWRDVAMMGPCDDYRGATLELYRRNQGLAASYISFDAFASSLKAHPRTRYRLYSGEVDPYSPPPYYADEAELGDRISYKMIAGGAHWDWDPVFADIRAD